MTNIETGYFVKFNEKEEKIVKDFFSFEENGVTAKILKDYILENIEFEQGGFEHDEFEENIAEHPADKILSAIQNNPEAVKQGISNVAKGLNNFLKNKVGL